MSYWLEKINAIEKQLKENETALTGEYLPGIKLSEFERRDIAVEVFSEILQQTIWLCSDMGMVSQVKNDSPGAVCYTVDELRSLNKLNTSAKNLKRINEAKAVFPGSTVIKSDTRGEILDRALAELDKEIPVGLDRWLSENDRELATRFLEAEDRVNDIYKTSSVSELREALNEYRELYREARRKMRAK